MVSPAENESSSFTGAHCDAPARCDSTVPWTDTARAIAPSVSRAVATAGPSTTARKLAVTRSDVLAAFTFAHLATGAGRPPHRARTDGQYMRSRSNGVPKRACPYVVTRWVEGGPPFVSSGRLASV